VFAHDEFGIVALRAFASGALEAELETTTLDRLRVHGTVPSSTAPGGHIRVFAEATDAIGLSSGEQVLELEGQARRTQPASRCA
jgi:hypothetical protein